MKYKVHFEYVVYGEVEVSLPSDASDHDITKAVMNEVIGNENKFPSEFDIDWKNIERTSE